MIDCPENAAANCVSRRLKKSLPDHDNVLILSIQELAKLTINLPIVLLFLSDAFFNSHHVLRKEICLKEFANSILILILKKSFFKIMYAFLKRIACYFFHLQLRNINQSSELRITG
jgi:hypothetical protein